MPVLPKLKYFMTDDQKLAKNSEDKIKLTLIKVDNLKKTLDIHKKNAKDICDKCNILNKNVKTIEDDITKLNDDLPGPLQTPPKNTPILGGRKGKKSKASKKSKGSKRSKKQMGGKRSKKSKTVLSKKSKGSKRRAPRSKRSKGRK